MNNAMFFRSELYKSFCKNYGIIGSTSSPYHPQWNGQAKYSNKILLKIIKRTVDDKKGMQFKIIVGNMG